MPPTSSELAVKVRELKAHRAPRVMVEAAVEIYTAVLNLELASEHVRELKANHASLAEVQQAVNEFKMHKRRYEALQKVRDAKDSRATPSEVRAAVEEYVALRKAEPGSFVSPEPVHPVLEQKTKSLPPLVVPVAPITHVPVITPAPVAPAPAKPVSQPPPPVTHGLPGAVVVGLLCAAGVWSAWKKVDQTALLTSITESLSASSAPGRGAEVRATAQTALGKVRTVTQVVPAFVLALSYWGTRQLYQRIHQRLGLNKTQLMVSVPFYAVGGLAAVFLAGMFTSTALMNVARQTGLNIFRTLLMGARSA